jgi:hypothetical protein
MSRILKEMKSVKLRKISESNYTTLHKPIKLIDDGLKSFFKRELEIRFKKHEPDENTVDESLGWI